MALTCGFYNSYEGDRKYDSRDVSSIFDGIINDGIFMSVGTNFIVKSIGNMDVSIGLGRAWFNGTWTKNDTPILLTLDPAELVLNRIDAVVLEIDGSLPVRNNNIKIVKGIPSSNAVRPTMVRGEFVNQYALAYIYLGKGISEITQANITNMVGTSETPFVTGILETVDIDNLIIQWGTQWGEWTDQQVTDFLAWRIAQENEYQSWETTQQTNFENWLLYISDLFEDNPAGALQAQIDILKNASGITYDNDTSKLLAVNVQEALDEIYAKSGGTGVFLNNKTTIFSANQITETFTDDGSTLVTTFNPGGTITEVYTVGAFVKTKNTIFNADGSISEVLI